MDNVLFTQGAPWQITSAQAPGYLAVVGSGDPTNAAAAAGFDISNAAAVMVSFEGTYTGQVVVHEQTFDPAGLIGWFPVAAAPVQGSGRASSGSSSSGQGYVLPAIGVRARIRVPTLVSGTLQARIGTENDPMMLLGASASAGGTKAVTNQALVVTASSAYASGNVLGALMTLASAVGFSGGTGVLDRVTAQCKSNQSAQIDVILFSANPTNSVFTNKAAVTVDPADWSKAIGVVHITDWTTIGTPSVGQAIGVGMDVYAQSGTSLYAVAVTRGTPTFASTSDLNIEFEIAQD